MLTISISYGVLIWIGCIIVVVNYINIKKLGKWVMNKIYGGQIK